MPYNFAKRFENEKGTNPEELIAAAHAACFSMALSMILGMAGMTADSIETKATVTLEQFRTHALTVIGNVFYSENRDFTSPEQYARERTRAAERVVARAAGKSA